MDIEDLNIKIDVSVDNLEDLKKFRRELEKIRDIKRDIEREQEEDDGDSFDPLDIGDDGVDRDRRPYFPWREDKPKWFIMKSEGAKKDFESSVDLEFEEFEDLMEGLEVESFEDSVSFHTESKDTGGLFSDE